MAQREEQQLGRRVSRTLLRAVAGQIRGGHGQQRDRVASGLAADVLAAAGEPTSERSCSRDSKHGDKTFKVHIDGKDLLPYLTGEERQEPAPVLLST